MVDRHGVEYVWEEEFLVMDAEHDVIIGLPTLISHILPLFVDSLYQARDFIYGIKSDSAENLGPLNHLIAQPWSNPESDAPEEDLPMPSNFSEPLHYLSMSHGEAVDKYLDMLSEHVDSDFAKNTKIMELLKSDIALRAFVPTNWLGINGFEPLVLETADTLPSTFRAPPRPINPKIYEAAQKEFKRLFTYFYVMCNPPRCSPLVMAAKATEPIIRIPTPRNPRYAVPEE